MNSLPFLVIFSVVAMSTGNIACADGDPSDAPVRPLTNPAIATDSADLESNSMKFYASDNTAEFTYIWNNPVLDLNNSHATASFLFNEKRDNALGATIMFETIPDYFPDFTLSFGGKLFAGLLSVENTDVFALGAGAEAMYQFPVRQFPLNLSAAFYFAPDILTFGQSDRVFDWNTRASLPLGDNIDGFVGIRFLQFDTRPNDRELDKQIHVGIVWRLQTS